MQRYSFRVRNGRPPPPDLTITLPDAASAKKAALAMCADLARDIVADLTTNPGWQVSVSDETGGVFYKVSVVAECC
jgi:hypothetical protein